MGIVHAKPEKPIWAKSTIYHDKNWAHWHTCKSRNQLKWSEMWKRQKTCVLKAGSRRKKMIHLWCGHLPYLANIILRPACPQSLTNRCETQYFDGKKGKCHSATSLRIYDASTYFLKMNKRPFFLKLAKQTCWRKGMMWQPHNFILLSVLSHVPTNQRLCFHFTGTNFHLWIVPDSPAKTLIESFVGDPKAFGFFISPFARRMELWKAGKYKSLTIEKSP